MKRGERNKSTMIDEFLGLNDVVWGNNGGENVLVLFDLLPLVCDCRRARKGTFHGYSLPFLLFFNVVESLNPNSDGNYRFGSTGSGGAQWLTVENGALCSLLLWGTENCNCVFVTASQTETRHKYAVVFSSFTFRNCNCTSTLCFG